MRAAALQTIRTAAVAAARAAGQHLPSPRPSHPARADPAPHPPHTPPTPLPRPLLRPPTAARAAESEREDRFVYDPLAFVLAGRKALARHGLRPRSALLLAHAAPVAPAAPAGWSQRESGTLARATAAVVAAFTPPPRPVPRLAMRTRFFDDAVLTAAWAGGRDAPDALLATKETVEALADAGHGPCQQVVMLGAGERPEDFGARGKAFAFTRFACAHACTHGASRW